MLNLRFALATLGVAVALATPTTASTVVFGVVHEGGIAPAASAPSPDITLGDFNATAGDPLLTVVGDVSIWGGVAHSKKSKYTDAWAMDFGTDVYNGTFNWQNTRKNPFDGILKVGAATFDLGDSGSIKLSGLTGVIQFEVDPRAGIYKPSPREVATWDLQLSQVPLPAGGWLMLSGLAGLGALRRLKPRN
ncbi:VPLPA-CTERM sorting domain-containing protein [Tropicimonas sp. S265A]|uniref:VPLPA-CTERM sorting domain-containing protein n=1 Tax=Tropicimonas sp. S265A TaxID=3415134 RepID=UPI003C7C4777